MLEMDTAYEYAIIVDGQKLGFAYR